MNVMYVEYTRKRNVKKKMTTRYNKCDAKSPLKTFVFLIFFLVGYIMNCQKYCNVVYIKKDREKKKETGRHYYIFRLVPQKYHKFH